MGLAKAAPEAIREFKPDVLYSTADPGSVAAMTMGVPFMPYYTYSPIEGEPIANRLWRACITTLHTATVSQYGADVVKSELGIDIPWYYHGVDRDIFEVTGTRDATRKALGWEDKFIINMTATNVKRKQITRLMQAFKILKEKYNRKDAILYLHTVPFQNHWLEGWNLMEIATYMGIDKDVFFHPAMTERNASAPLRTDDPENPGLVEMYNASDLFVLPSQVEGFGLPIAEAMACGLPVAVTQYAAGWEVAKPAGKGLPVRDWEVHKSGTLYANVDVEAMAQVILKLIRNPRELEKMRQRGFQRVTDFDWAPFEDSLDENLEKAVHAYEERSQQTQEENQGQRDERQEAEAQERVRTEPTEGSPEESDNLSEGQGEDISSEGKANYSWS